VSLATFEDANVHLDGKKIVIQTEHEAEPYARSADRIVRGALFDLYPDVVNLWEAPSIADPTPTDPTPGLVREIAALYMAHFKYASVYSEESQDPNSYAARLLSRAEKLVEQLKDGTLELADSPTLVEIGQPQFFPDDEYVDIDTLEPIRFFTVEQEF